MKEITESIEKAVRCVCGCGIIHFEYEPEWETVYISTYNQEGKFSLWFRLSQAWRVLKTGRPFADQIIINLTQVEELSDQLKSWVIKSRMKVVE